jgi:YVTN family beta-propeller protein
MKWLNWSLALIALLATGAMLWIVFPETPQSTGGLVFQGFTHLPKGSSVLSVLDYLTVDGDTLYVTNVTGGLVYEIARAPGEVPANAKVRVIAVGPGPHGVVHNRASGLAFVSHSESNTVDVFDPRDDHVLKHIPVADDPDAIYDLPIERVIYVTNGDAKLATLIDPSALRVAATIALGGKPEAGALDPRSHLFYQNLNDSNAIAVVDMQARKVIATWPIEGCEAPTGMALDTVRRLLFIGCGRNSMLVEFGLDTHHVLAAVPVGGGPDVVAYDAAAMRVYATGRSGVLSAVDAKDARKLVTRATIALHYGAHSLAIDPARHLLYAGYASLFIGPRVAVFSTP